jgi:hypothetical protein
VDLFLLLVSQINLSHAKKYDNGKTDVRQGFPHVQLTTAAFSKEEKLEGSRCPRIESLQRAADL